MKKILYFDCASGISGDMTLGALLDLGADRQQFLAELEKLHVEGYQIQVTETQKNSIRATHVDVLVDGEEAEHSHTHPHPHGHCENHEHADEHGHSHKHAHTYNYDQEHPHEHSHVHNNEYTHVHLHEHDHGHEHHHAHPHRSFADIRSMIENSALAEEVKELSLRIFARVARAEAKVHGKSVDEVHFHEVGAVDSIIDIVGCAILIHQIRPDAVYASVVHEGHGFVKCQHGMLPVPVPAASEIFAASKAKIRQIDIEGELVTPTGAAIIAELAEQFGTMPEMKVERIGWGAGTKNLPIPNVLKVYEGFTEEENTDWLQSDEIMVLETNLDDCSAELMGYAMEKLLQAGALDVSFTPVVMKKNRPAYRMTVLCRPGDVSEMERLMFTHTTTIGIRRHMERRSILKREQTTLTTDEGRLAGKKVYLKDSVRVYPEYRSAVELAEKQNKSLWEIYRSYGKF